MQEIIFGHCHCAVQGVLDGEEDISGQRVLSTGSHDSSNPEDLKARLLDTLSQLAAAVNNFLVMYAKAFRVDFTVDLTTDATKGKLCRFSVLYIEFLSCNFTRKLLKLCQMHLLFL